MKKSIKRVKIKKFTKSLTGDSFNQKVFFALIKSMRQIGRGLVEIAGIPAYLLDGFDMTSVTQKFHGTYYANKEGQRIREKLREEQRIRSAIKELRSMNYIKIDKNNRKVYLLEKGALEFLRLKIREKKPRWDGKWRVIIFDVPEERRNQRDFLRRRLKWLGFKELQKSVWIFPYDIKKEIEELLTICNFDTQGDIRFLKVDKMEDDKDLKRLFGL